MTVPPVPLRFLVIAVAFLELAAACDFTARAASGAIPALADTTATATAPGLQIVPTPPANVGELMDVAGSSSTDVWTVGERWTRHTALHTFAEHWDGTAWRIVRTPSTGDWNMLRDVAALSPTDAWAVGFGTNYQALAEHWDGTTWSIVPVTGVPSDSPLYGVQAFADDDVWAVGSTGDRGLIVHWDGASWS